MINFSVGLGFGMGLELWYDLGYWLGLGFGLRFGSGIRAHGLSCKSSNSITRPLTGGDLESASKIRRNLFF